MIRPLTIEELPLAAEIGIEFVDEGRLSFKIEPEHFKNIWTHFINSQTGIIYGAYENGALLGGIGGLIYPDINSGETTAIECFWYVKRPHRGSHGIRLLRTFENWAKSHMAKRIIMVHLDGLYNDKLSNIYKRWGYIPLETHYIKEF